MNVLTHDNVGADVRAVLFASFSEIKESPMNRSISQDVPSIESARRHEIDWRSGEDSVEATQTWSARMFVRGVGGHRPPLQRRRFQRVQQFLMDPFESAVAEHGHHILLFQ